MALKINKKPEVADLTTPAESSAVKHKCPNCGATDVVYNGDSKEFICAFCKSHFTVENTTEDILNTLDDVKTLEEDSISAGMQDIAISDKDMITFKCPGCGATMGLDPNTDLTSLTCHWCRHTISIADQVSNGVRPDAIIPFSITREQAENNIREALKKKKFFAHPKFVNTFSTDLVKPVYLPYVVVDAKMNCYHAGEAGIRKKTYKSDKTTYYDYDLYNFSRKFDLYINDLFVEGNSSYIIKPGEDYTKDSKNIVNSILPFHMNDIVDYDPKFFNGGYRGEFRDLNVDQIEQIVQNQFVDVSKYNTLKSMEQYTHGTDFQATKIEDLVLKYVSVMAPVWLYSYKDDKGKLNYIVVNGQTGETETCVPVNKSKLLFVSAIIEVIAIIVLLFILFWPVLL